MAVTQALLVYRVARKGPVSLAQLETALAAVDLFTSAMATKFANDGVTLFADATESASGVAQRIILFALSAQFSINNPTAASQVAYFRRMFWSTLSIALKSNITEVTPVVSEFLPSDVAGRWAWFRPDLGVTGSPVSALANQIPVSPPTNVVQANPVLRPAVVASDPAYGNQAVLVYTGTEALESIAFPVHPQPTSIFAVGNITVAGGTISDGNAAAQQTIFGGAGPVWSLAAGGGPVDSIINSTAPKAVIGNYDGAASELYVSAAAGGGFVTPAIAGNAGADGIDQLAIGAIAAGAGNLTGRVADLLRVDGTINLATRLQLRLYAQQRYGL
jgi:hypothetical protein